MPKILSYNDQSVTEAATIISRGGILAFPTETVYGLGANALDGQAVAKIFEAKERPNFNPLIVHFSDRSIVEHYVEMNETARQLASHFWPGALTLVLPLKPDTGISDLCTAGLKTLAVRVPAHRTAQALLKAAAVPIAAPSANLSGTISPTSPLHVIKSLGDRVSHILADGFADVGLESTILDVTGKTPVLLRPGSITIEQIETDLGIQIRKTPDDAIKNDETPSAPGQLSKHYAPSIPVRMNAVDVEEGEALLAFGSTRFMSLRGGGHVSLLSQDAARNLSEEGDLYEAASNLFKMLHDLDQDKFKAIAVMPIPQNGVGHAINDRLRRAAKK
ncbi:MAG: L-threonylcarbamoyladenylate synthase [Alphaproteobacteria bacterium]|jgi:L-threonylcarbamoyladenylate synthase|nr:L-threonylcarbamoyladenylate synthase [Alphaproteobacteria bacterium]MDP7223373.1 L-threonylcarbamoyladenylate synthase [Alphaproteobacteria bacterium]